MADYESNRPSRGAAADGPRKFTLELSLGGLITLALALVLGLVWVFILGVLLGRGHKPEKAVPEIAKVLPGSGEKRVEVTEPQPLKPEELKFPEALKQDEGVQPEKAKMPESKPAAAPPVVAPPAVAPPVVAPVVPEPAQASMPGADPRFRFVFQAASYNRREVAETTRSQLSSQGLSAGLETADVKGTTWYRVIVTLDGTEKDAATAMERMAKAGVPKPLLKSKKTL